MVINKLNNYSICLRLPCHYKPLKYRKINSIYVCSYLSIGLRIGLNLKFNSFVTTGKLRQKAFEEFQVRIQQKSKHYYFAYETKPKYSLMTALQIKMLILVIKNFTKSSNCFCDKAFLIIGSVESGNQII